MLEGSRDDTVGLYLVEPTGRWRRVDPGCGQPVFVCPVSETEISPTVTAIAATGVPTAGSPEARLGRAALRVHGARFSVSCCLRGAFALFFGLGWPVVADPVLARRPAGRGHWCGESTGLCAWRLFGRFCWRYDHALERQQPLVDLAEVDLYVQEATPGRIWIWSDLHLGHTTTISSFARPFASAAEMDDALFRSWHRAVNPGDTIICLGDVAIDGLSGTLLERLRSAPGHKVLVIGNHEVNRAGNVDIDGFDEIHSTLYAPGDPPLLLTHMPLRNVPDGCVNVHGHLHDRKSPSRTHHINVSIEQLRYRPRPWEAICKLARHMAAGDTLSGRTTAQRLTSLP